MFLTGLSTECLLTHRRLRPAAPSHWSLGLPERPRRVALALACQAKARAYPPSTTPNVTPLATAARAGGLRAAITEIPAPAAGTSASNVSAANEPEASMQLTISERAASLVHERGESVMVHLIPPLG